MRNLKKFLALVLAMMMALSLMITVNAATTSDFTDKDAITKEFAEDIEVLRGMGVFEGYEDGTFLPNNSITRAEVATIVYRIATDDPEGKQAHLYKDYAKFDDVKSDHWAAGYINFCANAEWIAGYGNGKFGPNDQVTGYQAAAMILRAVGYGKNGEFQGSGWQVQVANVTRTQGLLANVDKTTYANTLNQVANRELVGEILFQAANIPTVTWTMLGGYNKYTTPLGTEVDADGNPVENPSLGYMNYGLKSATRVILGNQATGEGGTLLGGTTQKYNNGANSVDVSYAYPGSVIWSGAVSPVATGNITVTDNCIRLAEKTGLDLFGHKVTVWYNAASTATWKPTYAMFDRASLTATVQSLTNVPTNDNSLSGGATKGLGVRAQKAGFTVNLDTSKAWISDSYGRITGSSDNGTTFVAAAGNTKSTSAVNNPNNGIYALISNNSDKTVDVIISLHGEVGIIAQKDTTSTVQTVTVGSTAVNTMPHSSFDGTAPTNGIFAVNSLTAESTQTLGDKVVAWQIVGTNNPAYPGAAAGNVLGNAGTHTNGNVYNHRYYLEKLEKTVTGTIQSVGSNNDLTMSDGTVYQQSWFRKLPAGGRVNDKVIGTTDADEPYIIPTAFQAGVNYTIALDSFGNWLGLVPARNNFIYGTFADYEFGGLGSGSIKYTITGVNWDGEKVINSEFKSLDSNSTLYPNSTNDLGYGYTHTDFKVTKKFLGHNNGQGNQILDGKHTGYVLDSTGLLTDKLTGYVSGGAPQTAADWTIAATDVINGFADVNNDGTLLATPNTKFIVVSGTGSDTLDVKVYNGISEFLNGSKWVTINCAGTTKGNTYYITEADRFNKWDTTNNNKLASVIMDLRDVTWSNPNNAYYADPTSTTDTSVVLAGTVPGDNIKQYKLWNNGKAGYYFVKTDAAAGVGGPSAGVAPTGDTTEGTFYSLIQIDTVNGTPIYKAVEATSGTPAVDQIKKGPRANGGICDRNATLTYTSFTSMSTLNIGGAEVFDITDAVVADTFWTQTSTYNKIENIQQLAQAVSGGKTVNISYVNDGAKMTTIYVINVT